MVEIGYRKTKNSLSLTDYGGNEDNEATTELVSEEDETGICHEGYDHCAALSKF